MNQLNCAAAILAISNMGLEKPDRDKVQRALSNEHTDLNIFISWFGQEYMETENDHDRFMEEARSWVDTLTQFADWKLRWPEIAELIV